MGLHPASARRQGSVPGWRQRRSIVDPRGLACGLQTAPFMKASLVSPPTAAQPEPFASPASAAKLPAITLPDAQRRLRAPNAPLSVAPKVRWPLPPEEHAVPPAVRAAQQGSRGVSGWVRPVVLALLAGLGGELAGALLHGHADHSPHIEPREVEWKHRGARPPITDRA